jgi:hypothetical protein
MTQLTHALAGCFRGWEQASCRAAAAQMFAGPRRRLPYRGTIKPASCDHDTALSESHEPCRPM